MTTILCDADIFAYRASSANQNLTERKPGCFTLYANGNTACKSLDAQIEALIGKLEADRIIMALSDKKNFRKKVLKSYKAHRAFTSRPLALDFVRAHIAATYETIQLPFLEGDDIIGILATGDDYVSGPKVIASIDKDMQTIPGVYFNLDKGTLSTISEAEANYYHMYQTLIGDTCDGYGGIRGVGPITAKSILDNQQFWFDTEGKPLEECSLWEKVKLAFTAAGRSQDEALAQARCARILRASDYDWSTREIKLWTPEK